MAREREGAAAAASRRALRRVGAGCGGLGDVRGWAARVERRGGIVKGVNREWRKMGMGSSGWMEWVDE